MMRKFCLAFVCVLAATPAFAAYNAAIYVSSFIDASGSLHVVETITGNAGEPDVPWEIIIADPGSGATVASIVGNANQAKIAALNRNRTLVTALTPGQALPVTFVPTPPATVGASAYRAAPLPFTPGTTPQDVCTLTGSATKTVSVSAVTLSTTQTTAGVNAWSLLKRSTANTSGTSAATAGLPVDTLSPAPTATVLTYTANPTAGTLTGRYVVAQIGSPAPASAIVGEGKANLLTLFTAQITLRGTGETLAVNFNGAALPSGLSVACGFEWSEQ